MKIAGIFHVHSRWSYDSALELGEIREAALGLGARFAVLAEHARDFSWERTEEYLAAAAAASGREFTFIPGIEYDFSGVHLVVAGASGYAPREEIGECLAAVAALGGVAVWAHPARADLTRLAPWLGRLNGIEVWSARYGCRRLPDPRWCRRLVALRPRHPGLFAYGGLDAHREREITPLLTEIEAPGWGREEVLGALRSGRFSLRAGRVSFPASGGLSAGLRFPLQLAFSLYRLLDRLVP